MENSAVAKNRKRIRRRLPRETSGLPKAMRKGAYLFCAIMCLPAIYDIVRYFIVNTYSVLFAFNDGIPGTATSHWSLNQFRRFFVDLSTNGEIMIALGNTLRYFTVAIVQLFICYFVAYFLYKKIPGSKVYRYLLFLPSLVPPIISVTIYKNLIQEMGPLWTLWKAMTGMEYANPFTHGKSATTAIIIYLFLTGFGTTYLIFIGAMNRIPQDVVDAAKLDGCSAWREFWSIIMPMTWGTFSTFLLMDVALIFTASGPILYFTGEQSISLGTQTLGYWIFQQVWDGYTNYPAAIGVIFTLCGIPILILTRIIINKLDSGVTY